MRGVALAACLAVGPARADGDLQRGRQAHEARCSGCPSVDADRIGPRRAGIVGRRAGSVAGFALSDALRKGGITWDASLLDRWLTAPQAVRPRQQMGCRLGDAPTRTDILAILGRLTAASR